MWHYAVHIWCYAVHLLHYAVHIWCYVVHLLHYAVHIWCYTVHLLHYAVHIWCCAVHMLHYAVRIWCYAVHMWHYAVYLFCYALMLFYWALWMRHAPAFYRHVGSTLFYIMLYKPLDSQPLECPKLVVLFDLSSDFYYKWTYLSLRWLIIRNKTYYRRQYSLQV